MKAKLKKLKKIKKLSALLLAFVMIVTSLNGISAYFTDTDTATNVVTVGEVKIDLTEPNWNNNHATTPNETVAKDPQVTNIGKSDAFVYLEVVIPYANVVTTAPDGTVNKQAWTELFYYDINDEWVEVSKVIYNEKTGTATHVYAYVGDDASSLEAISKDETTATLFDSITMVSLIDGQGYENKIQSVVINACGIQSNDIMNGETNPTIVWDVICNQIGKVTEECVVSIPIIAKDSTGTDLNASATLIVGDKKETLLESLDQTDLADKDDVDLLIDVQSDSFDDLADTTFDVSSVAKEGDTVVILHHNEETNEWEYVTTDTVDKNGTVEGNFSSFSPVAFVVIQADGTAEIIDKKSAPEPGLYQTGALLLYQSEGKAAVEGMMIKSWNELIADGTVRVEGSSCTYCNYNTVGELFLPSDGSIDSFGKYAFSECMELTGLFIPKYVNSIGAVCFEYCDYYDNLFVLFEDPNYWYVTTTENATSGIELKASELQDTTKAADLLSHTYCEYWWYKYPTIDNKNDDGAMTPGLYATGSNYTVLKKS
jgi:hypothetical protein